MYDFLESLPFDPNIICLSKSQIKNAPIVNVELLGYILLKSVLKTMPMAYLCTSIIHYILVKKKGLTFMDANAYG